MNYIDAILRSQFEYDDYGSDSFPDKLNTVKNSIIEGVGMYAWYKDGTQYVGTCGKTFKEAKAEIDEAAEKLLAEWKEKYAPMIGA